ncbi:MAG TPA: cupin domain-containing protein [Candidatus Acidoferrales bacterium]|nr:cupin domain-containing protein [Candidatus Acidoferrales bacterium]
MGTKFKEVNTLSFIGNIGLKTERVWKEVDEEADIIGCKDKFDRSCQLIAPLNLLARDLPGDGDTRQIPIFINDDVRIELMHCRSTEGANGRRPAGFCETQIQVQNKRISKTSEGDFELDIGDVLIVPPDITHENRGNGPTTRLIVYTRSPVQIAQTYPVKQSVVANKQCTLLKPTTVLDQVEEGGSGGKHFELVENADIMIETTHRSDAQKIYHRGFGQDEIAFQLSGRRATRTNQGEYMLETGDFLLIPPGTSHRNIGDMATIRIILYTRNPVRLADEFSERAKRAEKPVS